MRLRRNTDGGMRLRANGRLVARATHVLRSIRPASTKSSILPHKPDTVVEGIERLSSRSATRCTPRKGDGRNAGYGWRNRFEGASYQMKGRLLHLPFCRPAFQTHDCRSDGPCLTQRKGVNPRKAPDERRTGCKIAAYRSVLSSHRQAGTKISFIPRIRIPKGGIMYTQGLIVQQETPHPFIPHQDRGKMATGKRNPGNLPYFCSRKKDRSGSIVRDHGMV